MGQATWRLTEALFILFKRFAQSAGPLQTVVVVVVVVVGVAVVVDVMFFRTWLLSFLIFV
jgi:hypothetical protein